MVLKMNKIAELKELYAIETEAGFDIKMDNDTLVTVEQLNATEYGQPRFEVTNHVAQGLPRLDPTYRKLGAKQFVYWYNNTPKLASLIMKTLLNSPWNGVE